MSSTIQHLPPIMPFIEPTEPIELPALSEFLTTSDASVTNTAHQAQPQGEAVWKGKGQSNANQATKHGRTPSEEEVIIERARMELEAKIAELRRLENQLAQTAERERELASKISA